MANECRVGFTSSSNDIATKLYESLTQKGLTCRDLDEGHVETDFSGDVCPQKEDGEIKSCVVGLRDNRLEAADVFEYAMNHYEKYQREIEKSLGRPLPWALDDLDPATTEDADLRGKIQGVIDVMRKILATKGISVGSEKYQEILATGLYYLTVVGKKEELQKIPREFNQATRELEEIGLVQYREYLRNHGGLRFDASYVGERSALEAYRQNRGKCSERSSLLFGIFRQAGLKPFFVYVDPDLIPPGRPRIDIVRLRYPSGMKHIVIGLTRISHSPLN
ncbi:MAG: hypothetical protein HY073_02085 [Deltaproteobacteria bacterium]|nr:hypothetical protein [Deltaproteobacteria bacterium]